MNQPALHPIFLTLVGLSLSARVGTQFGQVMFFARLPASEAQFAKLAFVKFFGPCVNAAHVFMNRPSGLPVIDLENIGSMTVIYPCPAFVWAYACVSDDM